MRNWIVPGSIDAPVKCPPNGPTSSLSVHRRSCENRGRTSFWTARVLTALIVRPLRSLTVVANELSNGNVDVELPDIQTRDEIRDLADAIRGVMAALVTLVGEVEALSSAARPAASSEEEPGQGAHQQEAE